MKKLKWYWIDSSNKSSDINNESFITPMPEASVPHVHHCFKSKVHDNEDDRENSLLKRMGRDERYARESELDWEKVSTGYSYVKHFQRWEGRVVEIHEDSFVARLTDSTGDRMPRLARMKKTLINKGDWDVFFHEGFEFEWLFKEVISNGTFYRKNEIRFTPITHYLPDEIEEIVRKNMREFSYMLKSDD